MIAAYDSNDEEGWENFACTLVTGQGDNTKCKVHIFWEGHKILWNLHQLFDWQYIGQIIGGDFAKFCGLLRIYELCCIL